MAISTEGSGIVKYIGRTINMAISTEGSGIIKNIGENY